MNLQYFTNSKELLVLSSYWKKEILDCHVKKIDAFLLSSKGVGVAGSPWGQRFFKLIHFKSYSAPFNSMVG